MRRPSRDPSEDLPGIGDCPRSRPSCGSCSCTPTGAAAAWGGRLVDTCVAFAREAGYAKLRLWTNHPLVAARRIYLQRGFVLKAEEPHHSFGVDLVGQVYERDLRPTIAAP